MKPQSPPTPAQLAMIEEHQAMMHAMQSGVAMEMGLSPEHPKHFRVGINAAMRDHASLAGLLMNKGVFTYDEYLQALVDGMREEVRRYEAHLARKLGAPVTLR